MTKRIIALLMSLLLVTSVMILSGCGDKDTETSDEESSSSETASNESGSSDDTSVDQDSDATTEGEGGVKNLSAKELFQLSMDLGPYDGADDEADTDTDNGSSSIEDIFNIPEFITNPTDLKSGFDLTINKLQQNGASFINGEAISAGIDIAYDNESSAAQVVLDLNALGENPSISALLTSNMLYVTDICGVNEKVIGITPEDLGIDLTALENSMDFSQLIDASPIAEMIFGEGEEIDWEQVSEFISETEMAFITAVTDALENQITDDAFAKEVKTVTVDGVELSDVNVVTFTLTADVAIAVLEDIHTELSNNAFYSELMAGEDIDFDEMAAEVDGFKLIISNVVTDDAVTVASDVVITDETNFAGMKYTYVENRTKFSMGKMDENHNMIYDDTGVLDFVYSLNNNEEKLSVGMTTDSNSFEYIAVEGTNDGTTRKGSVNVMGGMVTLNYHIVNAEDNGKFAVSDVTVADEVLIKELSVEYAETDTKLDIGAALIADIEGISIDLAYTAYVELAEVELSVPADYDTVSDITNDVVTEWITDFGTNYPELYSFVLGMAIQYA